MNNKLDYEQIQTIQENTTRKLIKYINEFVKRDRILDSIEFYYPDFDEQKTRIAFNVWISIDYKTNYGKSFIEHMLEEKSSYLTSLEKEILIERNKSFISLFEIEKIEGYYVYIIDLLTRKRHTIWEPNISSILKPSDLIFGRIGRIIDYKGFIGNISFLPTTVKDLFIGEIFIDYNRIRFRFPELSIDKYLKRYSINVYRIYTECVYEVMDMDEDITNNLYDELDEFENYLQNYMSRLEIKRHVTNLINLFEYCLMEEELSLYDLDQLDIEHLLKAAIKDGFISTQREFSSYISTLKKYLGFLKNKNPVYRETYKKILEISKNRFLYIDNSKEIKSPFDINRNIVNGINNRLNEDAFDFIMDYEKFLLYIMSNPLEVTAKKKYIRRKHLLELNDIMEYGETINKKSPNQKDFPMLHLFYRFSLHNRLLKLRGNYLSVTKIGSNFLRLSDEEKYSLFLQYVWNQDFVPYNKKDSESDKLNPIRKNLLELLANLEERVWYNIHNLSSNTQASEFLLNIYKYLGMMGIFEYSHSPTLNISITSFGKLALNILSKKDKDHKCNGKIIYLNR
ncbi:hypothetical protein CULT_20064 [[Clostridium] ultunense Esp]|uniref:Uncharacterized protein n=1 Tax=[Clostridium] ultunense Esp TaxID=1288971 RepID=M1Z9V3_9FIRM|nr:hypothetical protein [Schnuerera ultunensis]CCQ94624.1 hypothetical protein CULT_20064 [[Clostridium] ultunense Esp]SHD76703.1 conserved protein of unknown function [[Clostridium] ultunense Esp]